VVTHPSCAGSPSTPAVAARFLDALVATGNAQILQPGPDFAKRCLQAAQQLKVAGPRAFDLQIGLLCLEAGVTELWTHDSGFVALPGLGIRDPLRAGEATRLVPF
jgi:hypothetical protein